MQSSFLKNLNSQSESIKISIAKIYAKTYLQDRALVAGQMFWFAPRYSANIGQWLLVRQLGSIKVQSIFSRCLRYQSRHVWCKLGNVVDVNQMTFAQYLAIYNNENLNNSKKNDQRKFDILPNAKKTLKNWQKLFLKIQRGVYFAKSGQTGSTNEKTITSAI